MNDAVESGSVLDVSKSVECSSSGSNSGDNGGASEEMLCFEDSLVIACDFESFEDDNEASSECWASGEADEEPARRSRSSSLLLSFLR